jgi:hypothetical protein
VNEPRRFRDDETAPAELRRLVSHGRAPRPLDEPARRRSRQRLVALASASIPASAGALLWVQHLALGAVLGTAVSAGVVLARRTVFRDAVTEAPVSSSARKAAPAAATERGVPPAAPPTSSPSPSAVPLPRLTASAAAPAVRPSASTAPVEGDGVAREAALLESARRSLGEPLRALSLLARHEHEFSSGVLATERELLMIDALIRAGRRGDAESRAARLRARMPGHLYEERLERLLGNQGESK